MIWYTEEGYLIKLLARHKGSVFPRSLMFAVPTAAVAVILRMVAETWPYIYTWCGISDLKENFLWSATTSVTGIMLGFRIKQALGRFWEGTSLLHQMRGEWFESVACLVTFSRQAKSTKPLEVLEFRHTLVRLMSFCHGSALDEIKPEPNENFDAIDVLGLDGMVLKYLQECKDIHDFNRVEVLLHMIQVLVTQGLDDGVLKTAPPILSRVYQTLSRGLVNLLNAKKITDTKFPFPFSQLITFLLVVYCILTPVMMSVACETKIWAAAMSFLPTFALFCLNFAAIELEMPFGDDDNDLPLNHFQTEMNTSLLMLLHENADLMPGLSDVCDRHFDSLQNNIRCVGQLPNLDSGSRMQRDSSANFTKVRTSTINAGSPPASPSATPIPSESRATEMALPAVPPPLVTSSMPSVAPTVPVAPVMDLTMIQTMVKEAVKEVMGVHHHLQHLQQQQQQQQHHHQQPQLQQQQQQQQQQQHLPPQCSEADYRYAVGVEAAIERSTMVFSRALQDWSRNVNEQVAALSKALAVNAKSVTRFCDVVPTMADTIAIFNESVPRMIEAMQSDIPMQGVCNALQDWMNQSDQQGEALSESLCRNADAVVGFSQTVARMSSVVGAYEQRKDVSQDNAQARRHDRYERADRNERQDSSQGHGFDVPVSELVRPMNDLVHAVRDAIQRCDDHVEALLHAFKRHAEALGKLTDGGFPKLMVEAKAPGGPVKKRYGANDDVEVEEYGRMSTGAASAASSFPPAESVAVTPSANCCASAAPNRNHQRQLQIL
eukprot:TRINITY_DN8325_c0_g5_i1.p1 TRINITY_DN8325_c0_g5~~TRINITY_DN8325_c0_g5_i1.p1  ORF type:complete len:775 (+),score=179.78 TRINITY_DN8325_c0_g5_i1:121-2445(+)